MFFRDTLMPVFPARAGMSPDSLVVADILVRFPRPRGDEPLTYAKRQLAQVFSPPARG